MNWKICYEKFERKEHLTPKETLFAECYSCNGGQRFDCEGTDCPLFEYMPYKWRPKPVKKPS